MRYYVNRNPQDTGEHDVHKAICSHGPDEINRQYLGEFSSCRPAVQKARKYYADVDGCYWCSNECHAR